MNNPYSFKGEIFDIGTGIQTTNSEIVKLVEKVVGKKANTKIVQVLRSFDTNSWVADNSLLKSIGWKQKHSLKEGLQKTIEYYERAQKKNS